MQQSLILVRHAEPIIDLEQPASEWQLSAAGRRETQRLAGELRDYCIHEIVSSAEPKATQTAAILAEELGVTWRTAPGLHEHERGQQPWREPQAWQQLLADFFAHPGNLVFGVETASAALRRFRQALAATLKTAPDGNLVIVSHGTVISLLLADLAGQDAFEIWCGLAMPDLRVLSRAEMVIDQAK